MTCARSARVPALSGNARLSPEDGAFILRICFSMVTPLVTHLRMQAARLQLLYREIRHHMDETDPLRRFSMDFFETA